MPKKTSTAERLDNYVTQRNGGPTTAAQRRRLRKKANQRNENLIMESLKRAEST